MTRSLQAAAQDLAAALNESCAVYTAQKQFTESLRSNTESTEHNLLSLLTAQQSNPSGAESQQQRREMSERMKGRLTEGNRLTEIKAMSRRWEQALCDSQIALMRLYAFPEARESCERIGEALRDLRLLQVAETPEIKPSPPPPDFGSKPDSEEERKKQMAGFALDFMQGMAAHHKEVAQAYEEQSQRTEMLINQVREAAEALTRHLNL